MNILHAWDAQETAPSNHSRLKAPDARLSSSTRNAAYIMNQWIVTHIFWENELEQNRKCQNVLYILTAKWGFVIVV